MLYNEFESYPFNLRIMKLTEYPYRVSKNMKFIYILEGSLSISFTSSKNTLEKNQVEIINVDEPYRLSTADSECTIAILSLSRDFVTNYSNDIEDRIYNCTSNEFYESGSSDEDINELKSLVASIITSVMNANENYLENEPEKLLKIVMEKFDDVKNLLDRSHSELKSERFYRIIDYIRTNLGGHISLDDIEKQEYLSKEYLSREFMKYFNKSFKEIQAYYRVMESSRLLLDTDESIEEISFKAGFSSKRYFYKYFDLYYKCTPHKFRLANKNIDSSSIHLDEEELKQEVEKLHSLTGYLNSKDDDQKDESPPIELRLRYKADKNPEIPEGLDNSILENINLEIAMEDIVISSIEDTTRKIANWISGNNITLKKITLLTDLERCKNEERIEEAKSLAKNIKDSLSETDIDTEVVLSIV